MRYYDCMIRMTAIFVILIFYSSSFANSPWLDLTGPGHAVGPAQTREIRDSDGTVSYQYGRLENGVLLPAQGEGFVRVNSPETSWGTGLMISLLTHASHFYVQYFSPQYKVHIASIAQENGGAYGPHKSHQNGLDADIYYMGQTRYGSVLNPDGTVSEKFDAQKNWDFWRILVLQEMQIGSRSLPAVYMIFIHPTLKTYLCGWAQERGLMNNPIDKEILKRLWPTVGHDTHFHLRLRCSPYYRDCVQQNEIPDVTGCP